MPSATWALQQAVYAALAADQAITQALGASGRIFDHVPPGAGFPRVAFAQVTSRDWSTGEQPGEEHTVILHVWSREKGKRQAQEIAASLRACLHDQPLVLQGHRLVNLRHESTDVRREPDGLSIRAVLRLRAVTEPL